MVLGPSGRIALVGHVVRGCLLCEAATVLIAERAPQRWIGEVLRTGAAVDSALKGGEPFPWSDLEMFAPVRAVKSRHRCVTLPFEALAAAIAACPGNDSG